MSLTSLYSLELYNAILKKKKNNLTISSNSKHEIIKVTEKHQESRKKDTFLP